MSEEQQEHQARVLQAVDQWFRLLALGEACCREIERVGADRKRTGEGGEG
jgi:hypothetical protein